MLSTSGKKCKIHSLNCKASIRQCRAPWIFQWHKRKYSLRTEYVGHCKRYNMWDLYMSNIQAGTANNLCRFDSMIESIRNGLTRRGFFQGHMWGKWPHRNKLHSQTGISHKAYSFHHHKNLGYTCTAYWQDHKSFLRHSCTMYIVSLMNNTHRYNHISGIWRWYCHLPRNRQSNRSGKRNCPRPRILGLLEYRRSDRHCSHCM